MPTSSQPQSPNISGSGKSAVTGLLGAAQEGKWSDWLIAATGIGIVAMVALSFRADRWLVSIASGLLVSGAALLVGAMLGFLFGIPRAAQHTRQQTKDEAASDAVYQVNTNLEQISDWLTKIIVGVGLIQVDKIPGAFTSLSEYVAVGFGTPPVPSSLVAASLLFLGLNGFLSSYLWTRLLLMLEFTRVDRAARQSEAFYEGYIQALLYQPAPAGFNTALEKGKQFIERFGEGNWRIWRSLACAFGQKYSYLKSDPQVSSADLEEVRQYALDATRRAIRLAPGERDSLRSLWDERIATPEENDLTVFFTDPEFAALFQK